MEKDKINNITVYGQSKFIQNLLTQVCKEFSIDGSSYSSFGFTALNVPSISIIDVENQMIFDKIVRPQLGFPIIYPVIVLAPNSIRLINSFEDSAITVLLKPLDHRILLKTVKSRAKNYIHKISNNMFLDSKAFRIIKLLDQTRIEICLTQIEHKILKYFVNHSENSNKNIVTEKEVLTNVLGYHALSDTNTFKAHMHRLKQKLGTDVCIIERKNSGYAICIS